MSMFAPCRLSWISSWFVLEPEFSAAAETGTASGLPGAAASFAVVATTGAGASAFFLPAAGFESCANPKLHVSNTQKRPRAELKGFQCPRRIMARAQIALHRRAALR